MARILILLILIVLSASRLFAEELLWPIANYQHLTGGYADSRFDHFHGGVDVRTGGKHLEVRAPLDGRIERIAISPSGYGKVVYFRMKNDTTVVFGHLDRFAPRLESIVRDSQLVAGTYRVNLIYEESSDALEFKRGETLAYTGQTGRGAPHLHFEMRREAVQVDPLTAYTKSDRQYPVVTELRFITPSQFDLRSNGTKLALHREREGEYRTDSIQSDEPVAFLISCYDPGPWNRHSVPSAIRVIAELDTIYEVLPTEIDLLGPKSIYAELVWTDIVKRDRDVRRLFIPPSASKQLHTETGWFEQADETPLVIEISDRSGNTSKITMNATVAGLHDDSEDLRNRVHDVGHFRLTGNERALSWAYLESAGSREVRVGDPLDGHFDRLTLTYTLSPDEDAEGLYWYKQSSKGKRALWTVPGEADSIMSCYLMRGGAYGIAVDKTPPRLLISRSGRGFSFDLRDSETGVDDSSVRCTIDGKTAIAEYEYEENGGNIWTQDVLSAGEHSIHFTAANKAGIVKEWDVTMTLP